ncbi:MAG: trypsin-like serine protease [Promethearchaeota archaeon]
MNSKDYSNIKRKEKGNFSKKGVVFSLILILIFTASLPSSNRIFNYKSIEPIQILSTSNVIGEDNRVRVTATDSYPWSAIVKLYITWGSDVYIGSGTMIDKNHVLTAGHCVYSHSRGGWADSVKIIPGADNGNEPFGHAWAIDTRSYSNWINNAEQEHDFAVITLDRDIGLQTGWMQLHTRLSSSSIYTGILNTAGYPADLDYGENMYWSSEIGDLADEFIHWYFLDIEGGQSGSSVWIYDGTYGYILSLIAYSRLDLDINYGPRINRVKFDCITNWLTADSSSTDKPDLTSYNNIFAGFTPTLGGSGLTNFEIWCKIRNIGTSTPNTFTISYYASPDTNFSSDDYLIGTDVLSPLSPTVSADSHWIGTLPNTIPSGEYYVGWIIDSNDNIDEFNENNNRKFIWDYKLRVDADPPTNPLNCVQLIDSTTSNVWQGSVNTPSFSWSSGSDGDTGIAGYYYYWGTNPNGTSTSFTTSSTFETSQVSTGTYYLRVKAKDNIGHNASWTTLYVFKYDGTAPTNPLSCDQLADSTESDVWQGDVDDPFFIWDDGYDNHTDVAGYYYYWGSHPFGTAPWTTLYIFKYKGEPINYEDLPKEGSDILTYFILYGLPILTGVFGVIFIYQVKERLKR